MLPSHSPQLTYALVNLRKKKTVGHDKQRSFGLRYSAHIARWTECGRIIISQFCRDVCRNVIRSLRSENRISKFVFKKEILQKPHRHSDTV